MSGPTTTSGPRPASRRSHGLPELIAERRAKGERLQAGRRRRVPVRVSDVEPIARRARRLRALQRARRPTTPPRRRASGGAPRLGQGAAFLDLVDRTGKIQLHARRDVLGEEAFERLTSLDIGDLIGVDGAALRSRRGELSLRVEDFRGARQGAAPAAGQARRAEPTSRRAIAGASST